MWKFLKSLVGSEPQNTKRETESAVGDSNVSGKRYILRMGELVEADGAFDAWTSGELSNMLKVLNEKTNLVDRHFLLMNIVNQAFKNRKMDSKMRDLCKRISEVHIEEFTGIAPALRKDFDGILPRVSTFQNYATVLTEDGEYERAIRVCQQAMSFGLHDGTQSGYEGRIARIKKKIGMNT